MNGEPGRGGAPGEPGSDGIGGFPVCYLLVLFLILSLLIGFSSHYYNHFRFPVCYHLVLFLILSLLVRSSCHYYTSILDAKISSSLTDVIKSTVNA